MDITQKQLTVQRVRILLFLTRLGVNPCIVRAAAAAPMESGQYMSAIKAPASMFATLCFYATIPLIATIIVLTMHL